MSDNGNTAKKSISDHFRINPFSVPMTIRNGLASIERFNTSKGVSTEKSLLDIATGITHFIELARRDFRNCLELEPYFGARFYDHSDTTGLIVAGCRFTFSFHGFKDKSKDEEFLVILRELEKFRDDLTKRASIVANETLGLDKLSISEERLEMRAVFVIR